MNSKVGTSSIPPALSSPLPYTLKHSSIGVIALVPTVSQKNLSLHDNRPSAVAEQERKQCNGIIIFTLWMT